MKSVKLIISVIFIASLGCRSTLPIDDNLVVGHHADHVDATRPKSNGLVINTKLQSRPMTKQTTKLTTKRLADKSTQNQSSVKVSAESIVKKQKPAYDVAAATYKQELDVAPGRLLPRESQSVDNPVYSEPNADDSYVENGTYESPAAQTPEITANSFPIDLPTVLQLAGADNWNVKIARERVCEAQAVYKTARVAWLPTMTYGIGYNHHEGQIQATEGTVSDVSRGSLFVGGGGRVSQFPVAGGSGGPMRFGADLSIAEAFYRPLAARQIVSAERSGKSRVFNDVMLEASLNYYDLIQAQSQLAIAMKNLQDAEELNRLTRAFVEAGKGTAADSSRMQVVVNQYRQAIAEHRASIGVASAELARVLQLDNTKLDPNLGLYANESTAPINLIDQNLDLGSLVASALVKRNDLSEAECRAQAAKTRADLERVKPFFPYLHVGYSGGGFGGGQGGNLPKLDSRSDVDIQLTWQLQNLGAGNRAARARTASQLNQSIYAGRALKDQIATEVSEAFYNVRSSAETMQIAEVSIAEATNALNKNIIAIQGLEGMPLEAVVSIETLAAARNGYLNAVMNYNRWQLRLIRAIGQPIAK